MSYAVRFLPADPRRRDEPAQYLSFDGYSASKVCRVTSVVGDVDGYLTQAIAARVCLDGDVLARCRCDHLVTDVVLFDVALADLKASPGLARPISMAGAYAALTPKERALLGREVAS